MTWLGYLALAALAALPPPPFLQPSPPLIRTSVATLLSVSRYNNLVLTHLTEHLQLVSYNKYVSWNVFEYYNFILHTFITLSH